MILERTKKILRNFFPADVGETQLSRRKVLVGMGVTTVVALAGSSLLLPDEAEADIILAQHRRHRDRDHDRHHGRDRHHDRGRHHGRRYGRGDLRRRCRHDDRFRHRNRGLCRRARGRGRHGDCVQVGPVQICD